VTTAATTSTWAIDQVHSSAEFAVQHLGISTFKGRFRHIEGRIHVDEQDWSRSSVEATIDVRSLDIVSDRLLGHLLTADFFDADQFPTITFKSTRVEKVDDSHWRVTGDLALHGETRPVTLDTEYHGQAVHPFSKRTVAAFTATTEINRGDFGLKWNVPLENGLQYVGEHVRISLYLEAVRDEPAA
jgi:polyisoprenoid-binding protein YceI